MPANNTSNRHLSSIERTLTCGFGIMLIGASLALFYCPPSRQKTEGSPVDIQKVSIEQSDPTTFAVSIFGGGALLVAFAANGLRMRRISKDGADADVDPVNEGSVSGSSVPAPPQDSSPKSFQEIIPKATETPPGSFVADLPTFDSLTPEERKIMATFWRVEWTYQKQGLPFNWGFSVPPAHNDYPVFWRGRNTLAQRKLITVDANGLVGLAERGVVFCQHYDKELLAHPEFWSAFEPMAKQ